MPKKLSLVAIIIAAGLPGAAVAGDADVMVDLPELPMIASAGGSDWYLRGDLGYAVADGDAGADWYDSRIDGDWLVGIGIGYRLNDLLRADVSIEASAGELDGRARHAACAAGGCAVETAEFGSTAILLNGYVDLGTISGLTPYVGAGLGATRIDYGAVTARAPGCAGGACGGHAGVRRDGAASWRWSFGLAAGVSYAINDHFEADLGYRFVSIDGGAVVGSGPDRLEDDGMERHEIRLGLRYAIW